MEDSIHDFETKQYIFSSVDTAPYKPIWVLAAENNAKPKVVTIRSNGKIVKKAPKGYGA